MRSGLELCWRQLLMKIESIDLENVRSHVKTRIEFTDGFNCLVGGLGTGKSSTLYAVDFALFGEPIGRSYDYLLREGAETSKIVLKFVQDGKEYTIQRGLKRQGDRIIQDNEQLAFMEGEKILAEIKGDAVAEQLQSVTGIDKDMFRDIIWVRQEHLKDVLNMTPRDRQQKMDQLFGLSDYETAWTNLRPVIRWFESESSSLERDPDVIGIKDLQARRDETVKDLSSKKKELEKARTEISKAEEALKKATERLEALEDVRRRNEKLKQKESQLQARLAGITQSAKRLAEEQEKYEAQTREQKKRLDSLGSELNSHLQKLSAIDLSTNLGVEKLREHAEALKEQISSNLAREESLRTDIGRAKRRIANLEKENTCPLCLQVLGLDYKKQLMERLRNESSENQRLLKKLEKETEGHESQRKLLDSVIQKLQTSQTRMEEVTSQLKTSNTLFEDAQRRLKQSSEEEQMVRKELETLRLGIREFDAAKLEEAQKSQLEAFEQHSSLRHTTQTMEMSITEVSKRLETLEERLNVAQKKVSRLETVRNVLELTQEIRQAYRSIQPRLRGEFVKYLEKVVQQVLDELTGTEGPMVSVKIDENYTPIVEGEDGYERNIMNLSGGERTQLAFAYRLSVGQLIMQWRAGHGLRMLLLDEPTESLGREDGSIDRLAESLARLKTVEQIIAVTHSEGFAEKADHVIRLEKRDSQSIASPER
jgi:exonuclease SbcC